MISALVADDTLYLLWVLVSVDNEGARRALLVVADGTAINP